MPIRNLLLYFIAITLSHKIAAQQDPQFSQYIFNQNYFNPALTSTETSPKIQLIHRSQYLGYTSNFDKGGTLNSQVLSFQMPLAKSNSGIGLVVVSDQAGLEKNQQFRVNYAKNFKVTNGIFSVGVSGGLYNKSYDSNLRPREANDVLLPSQGFSQIKPDLGIGIYYNTKNYFGGLSVSHLNNPTFDYGSKDGKSIINRNIAAVVGFSVPITNKIEVKPNLLLRTDLQTYSLEGGILGNFGTKYWLGANYRRQDAIIVMVGVNLMKDNSLKLGLAYDIVTGNSKIKSSSSAEILLSYLIGGGSKSPKTPVKMPIIRTPRYRH